MHLCNRLTCTSFDAASRVGLLRGKDDVDASGEYRSWLWMETKWRCCFRRERESLPFCRRTLLIVAWICVEDILGLLLILGNLNSLSYATKSLLLGTLSHLLGEIVCWSMSFPLLFCFGMHCGSMAGWRCGHGGLILGHLRWCHLILESPIPPKCPISSGWGRCLNVRISFLEGFSNSHKGSLCSLLV